MDWIAKDKEVLNEIIKIAEQGRCDIFEPILNTVELTELLVKEDEYHWHDLRDDPTDLPVEDCKVDFFLCCVYGKDEHGVRYEGAYEVCAYCYDGTWNIFEGLEVVAWRMIEPFRG